MKHKICLIIYRPSMKVTKYLKLLFFFIKPISRKSNHSSLYIFKIFDKLITKIILFLYKMYIGILFFITHIIFTIIVFNKKNPLYRNPRRIEYRILASSFKSNNSSDSEFLKKQKTYSFEIHKTFFFIEIPVLLFFHLLRNINIIFLKII